MFLYLSSATRWTLVVFGFLFQIDAILYGFSFYSTNSCDFFCQFSRNIVLTFYKIKKKIVICLIDQEDKILHYMHVVNTLCWIQAPFSLICMKMEFMMIEYIWDFQEDFGRDYQEIFYNWPSLLLHGGKGGGGVIDYNINLLGFGESAVNITYRYNCKN